MKEEFVKLNVGLTTQQLKAVRTRWVPEQRRQLRALMVYIRIQKLAKVGLGRAQVSTAEHDKFLRKKRQEFRLHMRISTLLRKGLVLKSDLEAYAEGLKKYGETGYDPNEEFSNPLKVVLRRMPYDLVHIYKNAVDRALRGPELTPAEKEQFKLSRSGNSIVDAVRNFIGI